jgi:diguanylate cyclase (GGDEF)-like protein
MLEAGSRVRVSRLVVSLVIAVSLIVMTPWLGGWPLLAIALGAVQVATLDRRIKRSKRPEYLVAFSLLFTAAMVAATVAMTGGPSSPALSWFVIPAGLMANRFRPQVVITGVAIELVMMVGVCVAVDLHGLLHDPTLFIAALTVLACVVLVTLSLSDTEMQLRNQAHATDGSVALIVYDLDSFKKVNDELGHDVGDAVLRDTARLLETNLRSVDLVYRLGGEEFAVVLPGAGAAEARDIAERQREAVERGRPAGLSVTISGGVAADRGSAVRWETLFRRADVALLDAKRSGRNRIVVALYNARELDLAA